MSTLLLRLAGPMQSWGTQSQFRERDTEREPSKSGVIGLLCAALGRRRWEPLDDLAALRMGVRVDREGSAAVDFQTAGGAHRQDDMYGVAQTDGSDLVTIPSWRYYLADASFLVGLEARADEQEALLHRLDQALAWPTWQLFLGRKAFVPGEPVRLPDAPPHGPGLRPYSLETALLNYPWPAPDGPAERLRFVFEAEPGSTAEVRADVPLSFAIGGRRFATRHVRTDFRDRPA